MLIYSIVVQLAIIYINIKYNIKCNVVLYIAIDWWLRLSKEGNRSYIY